MKHILLVVNPDIIKRSASEGLHEALSKEGFWVARITARNHNRAIEVFTLDHLPQADLDFVHKLCNDAKMEAR